MKIGEQNAAPMVKIGQDDWTHYLLPEKLLTRELFAYRLFFLT